MASASKHLFVGRDPDVDWENLTASATRQLRQSGGSVVVTVPPELFGLVGWEEGDQIYLFADQDTGEIILRRAADVEEASEE